jgi:heme-degrading monooxygenase HmoA
MSPIADTPSPPYYAVIFTSLRTEGDNGYEEMAVRMLELAVQQTGFLGVESARESLGITVSYWKDLDSIQAWHTHAELRFAQQKGREVWYSAFKTRICLVEHDYDFNNGKLQ